MKSVRYPTDDAQRKNLRLKYVRAIETLNNRDGSNKLASNQKRWSKLRRQYSLTHLPADIRKILKAEYNKLICYYLYYLQVEASINDYDKGILKNIFSYDIFRTIIAGFFMDNANGFDLRVCHYCGTAYINKYSVSPEKEGLDWLSNASRSELSKRLKIKTVGTLNTIIAAQPFTSVAQFNSVVAWRSRDKFHSLFSSSMDKNHFDLDHVLDKDSCPITAISLMNFVPSCSVCNEKLKKSKVLGKGRKPIEELSPTSKHFDFDRNVHFMLMPIPGRKIGNRPTRHENDYELLMDVKKVEYERFIDIFHLRERYQFHKMEALFWLEFKYRYTDSRIAMMARSMHDSAFTPQRIKDDIFQRQLDNKERCFEKLKKDILK